MLQVLRFGEIRHSDGFWQAPLEGRAGRQPHQLRAINRNPAPLRVRHDGIVYPPDAGATVVDEIDRDLDAAALLERQAQGLDCRQPA